VFDAIQLAAIKQLVDFGVPVETANGIVSDAHANTRRLLAYRKTPSAAAVAGLRNSVLMVARDQTGGFSFDVLTATQIDLDFPFAILILPLGRIAQQTADTLSGLD